jgi:adenylate cyclase class IV
MPANIEIKARARDFGGIKSRAEKFSDTPVEVIPQEDIFFNVEKGLKVAHPLARPRATHLLYTSRPGGTETLGLSHCAYVRP